MRTQSKTKKKVQKLERYEGKWVGLIGTKVVAADDTLPELDERVKRMSLENEPAYFLVPRKDEGAYYIYHHFFREEKESGS